MTKERIFIVEDERIIAIDLQHRLEKLGYLVCGNVASGEEALPKIAEQRPDLVLMDIFLPGAMDGIEVAIKIHNELSIPVIFLSAYTDSITLDRAKLAQPLGFILKPFKERELATVLEMALFKKITDSRIREKEQLFSALLNSTTDAILLVGPFDEIVFINPEAELILDLTNSGSKGHRLSELFTLSDMESGEPFHIPRLSITQKLLKIGNLRLTNRKNNSFIVEMSINRDISFSSEITNMRQESTDSYIISFKDISRLHEMTDTIKYQTSHDTLTGLLNRNELAIRLNEVLIKRSQQEPNGVALFIDIDHFRIINDSCGTEAGDQLLKETANRIRNILLPTDFAARCGGDDFVLVHNPSQGIDNISSAEDIATSLLEETKKNAFSWKGKQYPITLSIAIVPLNSSFKTEHDVMIAGTQTVFSAHESGGNHFTEYQISGTPSVNRSSISEWITRIHEALQQNRFRLFYQPIQPLDPANTATKVEILLRMISPTGEIINPGDFIPIAERYSLMPAIDRWVIRQSFISIAKIRDENNSLSTCIFSINLSGASLQDESIIGFILDEAQTSQIPPSSICIEVTESSAILNLASASRLIYLLKEQGFSFALDDFGSGFSSFNYLKNLPVDYLKIDGCFIRNMDKDPIDYTMVQAITSMCKVLGIKTIGEFAENDVIIGQLRDIGVDYAQGYGISRPIPFN